MISRNVRLEILRRARKIISVERNWGTRYLRQMNNGAPRYCVLGAIEQAAYDIGYAKPGSKSFRDGDRTGLGYQLGDQLSLSKFANQRHGLTVWAVNDGLGYETTLKMLDDYIVEVEEGRALEPALKGDQ